MSGGLIALLDDIATLAKATASSLDDIAAGATKASSKAVGVVIDDTAVTPQYVAGLDPSRELPIIKKIARASLINKLAIILPLALLLTWLAPWMLPVLLLLGGSFLSFEGAEKLLVKLHLFPEHSHEDAPAATSAEELEKGIVSSASRTDLILSAEIILISLANVNADSNTVRIGIMIAVAFFMTFFVYGLVALLVKMDDFGLHLSKRQGPLAALGRGIVTIMPKVFAIIGIVGTVATLIAAWCTWKLRDRRVRGIPLWSILMPAVWNFLFIGTELGLLFPVGKSIPLSILINGTWVAIGELAACVLGYGLVKMLVRLPLFKQSKIS